jgi:nucleoside-triphosphatase
MCVRKQEGSAGGQVVEEEGHVETSLVTGFESFPEGFSGPTQAAHLFIIDEIGKMECISTKFQARLKTVLDSPVPVLATIAFRATRFIEDLKVRPDVKMYELTRINRDVLPAQIRLEIKSVLPPNAGAM